MRLKIGLLCIVLSCLLSACAGMGVHSNAQSSFEAGLALFNQGQYKEAMAHFQKATELDPNFAQAYLYLGRSYLNLRQWLDALPPLRTALRLSPEETQKEIVQLLIDALLGAATFHFKQGNFHASIDVLKEALELQPQSVQVAKQLVTSLFASGGELLSQGKAAEAIEAYREVAQLTPTNLEAYLGLARAFFQHGDYTKALSAVRDALKISPTNLDALSLLRQFQRR
jgi:protein O-GlcNAc transferase